MEFLLDLGMSLPSTAGHSDHEMPPKHGQICDYKGALLTESWALPAASTKINSWPLQDADLQHPFERIETKNKVLCDLGKKEEKKKKNRPSFS